MRFSRLIIVSLVVFIVTLASWGVEQLSFRLAPLSVGKALLSDNAYFVKRELGKANFSPDLRYPVQLIYRSNSTNAGLFGTSWHSPQLESSAIPERNGVLWETPWGEKIRFYAKSKEKNVVELYKNAMKGSKDYFSPYSDWEADGRDGNWIFSGKRGLSGWKFAYRDAKLIAITAPSGREIKFNYDGNRLMTITQNSKVFLELSYVDNLVTELKINGVSHQFSYYLGKLRILPNTVNGKSVEIMRSRLITITSAKDAPIHFNYDHDGYLVTVKHDNFVDKLEVEHETEAQRLSYLKALAENSKPSRTVIAGRIKSDRFFDYRYLSSQPGKIAVTNRAKQEAKFDYDINTGIFKMTNFKGLTQTIYYFKRYDVAYNGKIRQIVDNQGRTIANYRYDKLSGQINKLRDIAGNEICYVTNPKGLIERVERRAYDQMRSEPILQFIYDPKGNLAAAIQLDENSKPVLETRFRYNDFNQPVFITNGQQKTSIIYNYNGYPTRVENTFGQYVHFRYDQYNRLISTLAPSGVTTQYIYDEAGRIEKIFREIESKIITSISIVYNKQGLPIQYKDHNNRIKTLEYDELGRVIKEFMPNGTHVEYLYDSIGQMTKVVDQNQHEINFSYNTFGLEGICSAEKQLTNFLYDKNGMIRAMISRSVDQEYADRKISYEYDDYGRLIKVNYGNAQVETFHYDTWGKLTENSKYEPTSTRSVIYTYDYFGRITEKQETIVENNQKSKIISRYAYNHYGQRTSRVITANGTTFHEEREYDQFGRLKKIMSGDDVVTYVYNDKNQLVASTINGITIRYNYTKFGQLAAKSIVGMEEDASLKYFYGEDGTVIGREVGGVKQTYCYDQIGQLLAVIDSSGSVLEKYTYDSVGNILSKTVAGRTTNYMYDKANQLVSSTDANGKVTIFKYDAAGRLIKEGTKTFFYGWYDKVIQIAENGKTTHSYTYDMMGQIATASYGNIKETFLWDGLTLLSRNAIKYVNDPAVTGGNPILANNQLLFNDILGVTLGIKDGEKFTPFKRDAFGELQSSEKNDFAVNFFTGKPEIAGLGYNFMFRNYRSDLGKWQTTDPSGYPDGWNNLAYVNNGVTTQIDCLGLNSILNNMNQAVRNSRLTPEMRQKATAARDAYILELSR